MPTNLLRSRSTQLFRSWDYVVDVRKPPFADIVCNSQDGSENIIILVSLERDSTARLSKVLTRPELRDWLANEGVFHHHIWRKDQEKNRWILRRLSVEIQDGKLVTRLLPEVKRRRKFIPPAAPVIVTLEDVAPTLCLKCRVKEQSFHSVCMTCKKSMTRAELNRFPRRPYFHEPEWHSEVGPRPIPQTATDAPPGSAEKIRIMRQRIENGEEVHHADDRKEHPDGSIFWASETSSALIAIIRQALRTPDYVTRPSSYTKKWIGRPVLTNPKTGKKNIRESGQRFDTEAEATAYVLNFLRKHGELQEIEEPSEDIELLGEVAAELARISNPASGRTYRSHRS